MAKYDFFVSKLLRIEGGYSERQVDKGNWVCSDKSWATGSYPYNCKSGVELLFVGTNMGIAAPTLANWLNKVPSVQEMKELKKATAIEIFETNYWRKIKGDYINSQELANIFMDGVVNHESTKGIKMMQETLNEIGQNVSVDGIVGPKTIKAINSTDYALLHNRYRERRRRFYYAIIAARPHQEENINGWINRLDNNFPNLIGSSDHILEETTTSTSTPEIGVIDSVDILLDEVTGSIQEVLPIPRNKIGFQIIKILIILAVGVGFFLLGRSFYQQFRR